MENSIFIIVSMALLSYSCQVSGGTDWNQIIDFHMEKYPGIQSQDIYKMVYQGVLGPGHLGIEKSKILYYLDEELSQIDADPYQPLIENISPDSSFIRIDLHRYKFENYSSDDLARLILKSSIIEADAKMEFIRIWQDIARKVERGRFGLDREKFREFNQYIIENDYPVVHHSEEYIKLYDPAYRVISLEVWRKSGPGLIHDN